jgi:hypothetical protein
MDPTLKTDVANVRLAFPDKLGAARLPNVSKEPISCAWFRFLGGGFENDAGLLLLASQKDPRKPSLPIFPARADYVDGPPSRCRVQLRAVPKGGNDGCSIMSHSFVPEREPWASWCRAA